jgi:hypothetical protein
MLSALLRAAAALRRSSADEVALDISKATKDSGLCCKFSRDHSMWGLNLDLPTLPVVARENFATEPRHAWTVCPLDVDGSAPTRRRHRRASTAQECDPVIGRRLPATPSMRLRK